MSLRDTAPGWMVVHHDKAIKVIGRRPGTAKRWNPWRREWYIGVTGDAWAESAALAIAETLNRLTAADIHAEEGV